jgi:hypothetical protein
VLRRIIEPLALILLGVVLGLGSLAAITWAIRAPYEEAFGPWRGTSIVGRVPEGPYQRLAVATRGLVGLPRSETVYLEARVDEDGRAFEPGCRYRIHGPALPARWWSLTPYDADWELIPNPDGVYSVGSHNATLDARGEFSVWLALHAAGPAQLPLGPEPGTFLVLRLYHPEAGVAEHLGEIAWPAIEREGCP